MIEPGQGGNFTLEGCVTKHGKPFVLTKVDDVPFGQLTPGEAINHGIRAIMAAIEAERDASLIHGMQSMDFDARQIVGMLTMMREFRGQVDPDPRNDVPEGPRE